MRAANEIEEFTRKPEPLSSHPPARAESPCHVVATLVHPPHRIPVQLRARRAAGRPTSSSSSPTTSAGPTSAATAQFHQTPNLDRLATQAACGSPTPTPPARSARRRGPAIMTGKYPARLAPDRLAARPRRPARRRSSCRPGLHQHLPLEEVTLAEALKAAGYATGHHRQVAPGRRRRSSREQHGFDVNIARRPGRLAARATSPRSGKTASCRGRTGPEGEYLTDRLDRRGREVHRAQQGPAVLPLPAALRRPHPAAGEGRSLIAKYQPSGRRRAAQTNPDLRGDDREPGRERRPGHARSSTS